jgi:hypothetical protein
MKPADKMWHGLLWAILGTGVGLLLFGSLFAIYNSVSVMDFLRQIFSDSQLAVKIMSLAQMVNIGTFYFLLNKRKSRAAKGVILFFFVMVLVTLLVRGLG